MCSWTRLSVSLSHLVPICSKLAELSPFDRFRNGGRHHLGFLHYVYFDSTTSCGSPLSACVSNSVQI